LLILKFPVHSKLEKRDSNLKEAKLALNWMRLSDAKNGFWRGDRLPGSVVDRKQAAYAKHHAGTGSC